MSATKEAVPVRDRDVSDREWIEINKLFDAYNGLKRLGWQEPRYSDIRDGEHFELIELGSTGIHRAHKEGPYVWVDFDEPANPFLVRKIKRPTSR